MICGDTSDSLTPSNILTALLIGLKSYFKSYRAIGLAPCLLFNVDPI